MLGSLSLVLSGCCKDLKRRRAVMNDMVKLAGAIKKDR